MKTCLSRQTIGDYPMNRRDLLQSCVAAGAAALTSRATSTAAAAEGKDEFNGRINQSIVFWCFNTAGEKWDIEKTCQVARQLGCVSVELCEPSTWPVLRRHGLTCAIAPNGMPGAPFKRGFNNSAHRAG